MTKPINITIIAGLIIVAGLGVYFAKYRVANAPITSPDTNIVGDDKDEHSCIGSAGYSWCGEKDKCLRVFEELCPDVITSLIAELKTETDISLTKVGDLQLTWNVREGNNFASEAIPDISYKNSDVTFSNYQKIEKFMKSKYRVDINNEADGVTGGLRGYTDSYVACQLSFKHNQIKNTPNAPSEPVGDSLTVEFGCGYFNPNDVPKIVATQYIKLALATKYKKDIKEVNLEISKFDGAYTVGSVFFGPAGTVGEGGIFLATKQGDTWKLIYDGNGSIDCATIKKNYQFPTDMLIGFCD